MQSRHFISPFSWRQIQKHSDTAICANLLICQICCQKQPTRFIKGKQCEADTVSEPSASLFVLHTLNVCEAFTCNCLHGGEQPKFLSSPQPARPSLPAAYSTEHPYTSPITAQHIPRAISMTAHVHTSIGAAQEIPELHVGSRHTEDRTSAKTLTPVCAPVLSLHFLVVLYAVTYRRGRTPAH